MKYPIYITINIVIITLCIQCTFRRDDVILEAIINYQTMSGSCSHQIPFMAVACNQDKIIVECKVIIVELFQMYSTTTSLITYLPIEFMLAGGANCKIEDG